MTCSNPEKIKHPTKAHAELAIRSLERAGKGSPDYHAYRCDGHWHVGHSLVKFRKRIRASLRVGRR